MTYQTIRTLIKFFVERTVKIHPRYISPPPRPKPGWSFYEAPTMHGKAAMIASGRVTGTAGSASELERAENAGRDAFPLIWRFRNEAQCRWKRPNSQVYDCQRRCRNGAFCQAWLAESTRLQYWRRGVGDRNHKILTAQSVPGKKLSLNAAIRVWTADDSTSRINSSSTLSRHTPR